MRSYHPLSTSPSHHVSEIDQWLCEWALYSTLQTSTKLFGLTDRLSIIFGNQNNRFANDPA